MLFSLSLWESARWVVSNAIFGTSEYLILTEASLTSKDKLLVTKAQISASSVAKWLNS